MTVLTTVIFLYFVYCALQSEKGFYKFLCVLFLYKAIGHTYGLNFFHINLRFVQLYGTDMLMIIIFLKELASGEFRYLRKKGFALLNMLFFIMALLSMLRGVLAYGIISDLLADVRSVLYFTLVLMYFSKYEINLTLFKDYAIKTINILVVYCFVCWFLQIVGIYITPATHMRILGSDYASIIGICCIISLYENLFCSNGQSVKMKTLIYLLTVVLLQHNSVWISTTIGMFIVIGVYFIKTNSKAGKFVLQLIGVAMVICVIMFLCKDTVMMQKLLTTFDKFNQITQANSVSQGEDYGTFSTRIEIWVACLASLKDEALLIGQAMGHGYHVPWRYGVWNTIPHSAYVETIMRTGLIGVGALLLSVFAVLIRAVSRRSVLSVAIILSILAYWINYGYSLEHGMIIGSIASLLCSENILKNGWDNDYETTLDYS